MHGRVITMRAVVVVMVSTWISLCCDHGVNDARVMRAAATATGLQRRRVLLLAVGCRPTRGGWRWSDDGHDEVEIEGERTS